MKDIYGERVIIRLVQNNGTRTNTESTQSKSKRHSTEGRNPQSHADE